VVAPIGCEFNAEYEGGAEYRGAAEGAFTAFRQYRLKVH
jgi:hypothetical protein